MQRVALLLIWVMFLGIPLSVSSEEYSGNVNFFFGEKELDDEWEPVEEQGEFGIMVDWKKVGWPVSIAIDFFGSSEEDNILSVGVEGKTSELCFGIRKIWEPTTHMRPFLGGGLTIISAELEIGPFNEKEPAVGVWLVGGVYFTPSEHFNIGVLMRYSDADEVTFRAGSLEYDFDVGGTHAGLILGYHW